MLTDSAPAIVYLLPLGDDPKPSEPPVRLEVWQYRDAWYSRMFWVVSSIGWNYGPCANAAEAIGKAMLAWYCELHDGEDVTHNDTNLITLT